MGRFCATPRSLPETVVKCPGPSAPRLIPWALGLRFLPPRVGCSGGCHRSAPCLGNVESLSSLGWMGPQSSGPTICGKGSLDEFIKPLWFGGEGRAAFSYRL